MKDDKSKLVILGILVLIIVVVGGFQLFAGLNPPAAVPTAKDEKKTDGATGDAEKKVVLEGESSEVANPEVSQPLAVRDPFLPDPRFVDTPSQPPAQPTTQPPPPRPQQSASRPTPLPPFPIAKGGVPGGEGVQIQPAPGEGFGYTVAGVVVGNRPAAIFADNTGNQRLVVVGGSLDGDSQLVAVEKGTVTVRHRGQTLRLKVGGNP